MTTPLENYIQQRDELFEKLFIANDPETGIPTYTQHPIHVMTFTTETTTHLIEMMREMVRKGNLDPDFEYKKEYYNGHNELQQHLLSQLPNLKQS